MGLTNDHTMDWCLFAVFKDKLKATRKADHKISRPQVSKDPFAQLGSGDDQKTLSSASKALELKRRVVLDQPTEREALK